MKKDFVFKPYMKVYINSKGTIYKHANSIHHENEIKEYNKIFN